jgi:putative hemolysin
MKQVSTIAACAALLAGCQQTPTTQPASVGIANPASTYCISLGGKLTIKKTPEGETGFCQLPDGTVIEEWALFRRDHPQPAS